MRRIRSIPLAVAVVLAAVLAAAAGGRTAAVVLDEPGASEEGVRVHGAWKLVVRDRAGNVVARRSFTNDLTSYGGGRLAAVLSREVSVGHWSIMLDSRNGAAGQGTGICVSPTGAPASCQIGEPGIFPAGTAPGSLAQNLVLTVPPENAPRFTLSGSIVAKSAASVRVVSTVLSTCDGPQLRTQRCTGSNRGSGWAGGFTRRVLPQPLPVAVGQQVEVSVTLSFS